MELEYIKQRLEKLGSQVGEEDLMAHVISNLGKEYDQLVNVVEGELEGLTFNKLRERIRSYYNRVIKVRGPEDTAEDHALWHQVNAGNKTNHLHKFKGRCNKCGKYGHKVAHCQPDESERGQETSQVCHFCKKTGHIMRNCYKLKTLKEKKGRGEADTRPELALIVCEKHVNEYKEIWYADSGASCHMTNDKEGLINVQEDLNKEVMIGDGTTMTCKAKGSLKLRVYTKGMKEVDLSLKEVYYIPELKTNLFSLSGVTKDGGVTVRIERESIVLGTGINAPLPLFGRDVGETLYQMCCKRMSFRESAFTSLVNKRIKPPTRKETMDKTVDVNIFHQRLGHPSEIYTRTTAKIYGIRLTGNLSVCEGCAYGKAHQRPVKKFTQSRASLPLERIFVDTSLLPNKSLGGSKFWIMVVDDATRFKRSYFVKSKDGLGDMIQKFIDPHANEYQIKYLRCDNAGENQILKEICGKCGIKMEWTAPNTPQENGVVERGFAIVRQRAVAMMAQVSLEDNTKQTLWAEVLSTATE